MDNDAPKICSECNGTGKEICQNPDHGFRDGVGGIRLDGHANGCPCCGNDPDHIVRNSKCDACNGTGYEKQMTDEETKGLKKVIAEVEQSIEASKSYGDDGSEASWGYEKGILISRNDAELLLKAISESRKGMFTREDVIDFTDSFLYLCPSEITAGAWFDRWLAERKGNDNEQ